MNEKILSRARELLIESEYLFNIALEIAEEEINEKKGNTKNDRRDAVLQTADIWGEESWEENTYW